MDRNKALVIIALSAFAVATLWFAIKEYSDMNKIKACRVNEDSSYGKFFVDGMEIEYCGDFIKMIDHLRNLTREVSDG